MKNRTNATPMYGGRALSNGVLMIGNSAIAVAIRDTDGTILTAVEPFRIPGAHLRRVPIVRGIVAMGAAVGLAVRSSRLQRRLSGAQASGLQRAAASALPAAGLALGERTGRLWLERSIKSLPMLAPLEMVTGVALPFVAFSVAARLPGAAGTLQYHGAEHMAVNAVEAGLPVTVEHAGAMSRIHPRCGTSFAFWTLLGGAVMRRTTGCLTGRQRNYVGLASAPLLLGIAYEVVRLGAQFSKHPLTRTLYAPAWQAQRLTTAPPDEDQLEVACTALQAVMDFETAPEPARSGEGAID